VAAELCQLVADMHAGPSYVSPTGLRAAVEDRFPLGMQADGAEVLEVLLDAAHETANAGNPAMHSPPATSSVPQGLMLPDQLKEAGNQAWALHSARHASPVVDLYQGQLLSQVQCNVCHTASPTFDPFMLLCLPVQGQSVYDCLQHFTQEEAMQSWACPRCKGPVSAQKQFALWRLPQDILLIQLKRFKQTADAKGSPVSRAHKITNFIDFPVRGLDMSASEQGAGDAIFDLRAVVNHVGTLSAGHYTAYAKHEATNEWYEFKDAACIPKTEAELVTNAAYLLVYQRRRQ
jgi:ubiquitin carboxyl-terminal hydrolase 8